MRNTMNRDETADPSRRRFVATAATTAAAVTILPRHVLGGPRFVAPSDKVNVAVIGVGGQGRTNVRALLHEDDCQIVALADPCEEWDLTPFYYGGRAGRGPVRKEIEEHYRARNPGYSCAVHEDFRVMLDKEKGIDAVLVATPDHLHAYAAILAMKAGKHIYCEKPLTRDIGEARLVARVAKETGVATQMGNQGRSTEGHRQTAEWIWDGAIGTVREVHGWGGTFPFATGRGRPPGTPDVPAGFNWDLWLGPAEWRPYHPAYAPFGWRGYWAFGGGALPDLAIHHLDPAFNALFLDVPQTIEATAVGGVDAEVVAFGMLVTWRFPERQTAHGTMAPVTVQWYDGGLRPPVPAGLDPEDPRQRLGEGGSGVTFIGDKGIITCAGWSGMPRLLPMELHREYKRPEKTLPRVPGHHADWLQACKGGTPASGSFDYGARLCEFIMLGNVALRAQKPIQWDGPSMKARNADVERFVKSTYRAGWELPV
jgi:predicted dehydrogenase